MTGHGKKSRPPFWAVPTQDGHDAEEVSAHFLGGVGWSCCRDGEWLCSEKLFRNVSGGDTCNLFSEYRISLSLICNFSPSARVL